MEFFPLYSKIAFFVAYMITSVGLIIYLGSKDISSKIFSFFLFFGSLWVFSRGIFHGINNADLATEINKVSFFLGNVIGVLTFSFVYVFPENRKIPRYMIALLILSLLAFIPFYLNESIALGKVFPVGGIQRWGWEQGPWLFIHDLHYVGLVILSVLYFPTKIRGGDTPFRNKSYLMLAILCIIFIPTITVTNILPRFFNIFSFDWMTSIFFFFTNIILGYSIIKYNQMNTRTVTTEFLVLTAMGLLFFNIFI